MTVRVMTSPAGLRERKKQKTRASIQREAMRLFREQGYEETTIDQIAAAAEISPSTFFNYFPTKEDVVFQDEFDPVFARVFAGRPADEPVGTALRRTLESAADLFDRDKELILARSRLVLAEPELRARVFEEMEKARDLVSSVIAQRTGRSPADFEIRVTAMIMVMALYEAAREWARGEGRGDFLQLLERALDVVESGTRLD
jgi:AcrR family transcriptional regulator